MRSYRFGVTLQPLRNERTEVKHTMLRQGLDSRVNERAPPPYAGSRSLHPGRSLQRVWSIDGATTTASSTSSFRWGGVG